MSNEQINIAIADASGLPWVDFCNDLNAMHEAEKMLTEEQCVFVRAHLHERLEDHPASRYLWHATARERAKAFLRVIGKWKEDAK